MTTSNFSNVELIPIYTDWANRHLSKTSSIQFRPIRDISNDFRDYRIVAQLINVIVPLNNSSSIFNKKLAKTTSNLDGLAACLEYLQTIGLDCTKLTKSDIDSGNLGAVLQLLYLLSTFKQKLKQTKKDQKTIRMPPNVSKLPSPQQRSTVTSAGKTSKLTQQGSTMTSRIQPPSKILKSEASSKIQSGLKPKGSGIKPPVSSSSLRSSSRASGNNNVTSASSIKSLDSTSSTYSTISSLRPPTASRSTSTQIRAATNAKLLKIASPSTKISAPPAPKIATIKSVSAAASTTQSRAEKKTGGDTAMLKLKLFTNKTPASKDAPSRIVPPPSKSRACSPSSTTKKHNLANINYRQPSTTSPQSNGSKKELTRCSKNSEEESGYAGFASSSPASSSSTEGSFSMHSASSKSYTSPSSVSSPSSDEMTLNASISTTIRQKSIEEKPILAVKGEPQNSTVLKSGPATAVISPMMTHKKLTEDAPPSSEAEVFEEKGREVVVPPQMAPIRHQPPTYDQLLKQGKIMSPVKTLDYVDSLNSDDSLNSLTINMTPPLEKIIENRKKEMTTSKKVKTKNSESSGYTSEGGYAAFAKMREKLKEYDDMTRRAQEGYPDTFEDSSSLSSGISDNIEFDNISTSDLSGVEMATVAKHADYSRFARGSSPSSLTNSTKPFRSISSHRPSAESARSRTYLEQENIHKLLSQCRTSQRGAATATSSSSIINSNNTSRFSLKSPGYATFSPHLTVSADHSMRRPSSSASHKAMYSTSSGFHSLDRKCHLQDFSTDNRIAALLSPRRVPNPPTALSSCTSSLNASGMSRSLIMLETLASVSQSTQRQTYTTSKRNQHQINENGSSASPITSRRSHSPRAPPSSARIPLSIASPAYKGSRSSVRSNGGRYGDDFQLYRLSDDVHQSSGHCHSARSERGSQLSLASTTAYGSTNEKYEHAIREMSKDLEAYQLTINNLTKKQENYGMMFDMFERKLKKLTSQIEKANLKSEEQAKLKTELESLRDFSTKLSGKAVQQIDGAGELLRQPSLESVASHRSSMSSSSKSSKQEKMSLNSFGKSKKSWAFNVDTQIRSSLSKLTKKKTKHYNCEAELMPSIVSKNGTDSNVVELRQELRNREHALTEVRLDALDRAREVDVLKEAVHKLKNENKQLKKKVDFLTNSPSRASSQASLPLVHDEEPVYDAACGSSGSSNSKRSSGCNSIKVTVNVDLVGKISSIVCPDNEIIVGYLTMPTNQTLWKEIDTTISALFETYLQRIDGEAQLDLNAADAILGYQIGDYRRVMGEPSSNRKSPSECLHPTATIRMFMKGASQNRVDSLVLDTLLPRQMIGQLVKYIVSQRRLVLAGAAGIGKSKLAKSLATYVSYRFNIEQHKIVEIRIPDEDNDELLKVEKQLENILRDKTSSIVILDNIPKNKIAFVAAVFANVPLKPEEGSFVLCTVNRYQIPELQINQNFKMFLLTNRMDGVNGFMLRFLRRRTIEAEYRQLRQTPSEMVQIVNFLPTALQAVNQFIEKTNSIDVTIGPRVFLQCPLAIEDSRRWFIKLWNENFVPYMERVAREGKKTFGRCTSFEDPTDLVCEKWPWMDGANPEELLKRLSINDLLPTPSKGQFNPLESLIQLHATKHSTIDNI